MTPARQSLDKALREGHFVDVSDYPGVKVRLAYGTVDNLLHVNVYDSFQRALLHPIAAEKFRKACELLQKECPGYSFLVFDALRPQSAQEQFWELVRGTDKQIYFADPAKGSLHSYGFAIDLGLLDRKGNELDMGTPFDDLSDLAQPRYEEKFLKNSSLSQAQLNSRLLLRGVMTESGFEQLPHEWWHYDALPGAEVRSRFDRLP